MKKKYIYFSLCVLAFSILISANYIWRRNLEVQKAIIWVEELGGNVEREQPKYIEEFPSFLKKAFHELLGQELSISISTNEIHDLKPLANLTKLKKLYLWDSKVDDISHLNKLDGLEVLYILETRSNAEELQKLELTNPNLKVIRYK